MTLGIHRACSVQKRVFKELKAHGKGQVSIR